MTGLSNAEAALLGLLSEGPMHPYKIEQEVKFRDMRFWTELSMSSIYKLLRRLEKNGMVLRRDRVSPENRLRKTYSISAKGKSALGKKVEALLSVVEHTRWPIDIGIYNGHVLPFTLLQKALKRYRAALEKKVESYRNLLQFLQNAGCPPYRFGVATRPAFLLEAEMRWVDAYLHELEEISISEEGKQ